MLLTNEYTIERHLETFEKMAGALAPYIDRCIFSFVEMYKKLETNMPEIIPLSVRDMDVLARGLGSIAPKIRRIYPGLRYERGFFALRRSRLGLNDARYFGKSERRRL